MLCYNNRKETSERNRGRVRKEIKQDWKTKDIECQKYDRAAGNIMLYKRILAWKASVIDEEERKWMMGKVKKGLFYTNGGCQMW